ncbi:MAG: imidazole glycerol phosphate synthase subunit HisH [Gemmatimonadota bacterium]
MSRDGGVIGVVDYAAGNLRSVEFALDALGVAHRRAAGPEALERVAGIVLPGVGAARHAMRELARHDLVPALRETDRPLLGVCLGMQLLTEASEEGEGEREERRQGSEEKPAVECLGLLPGRTRRLRGGERLPHIGWNPTRLGEDPLFRGLRGEEPFYYLHAYRVTCPPAYTIAEADYGEPFPAAIRRGRLAGVQFHPEKSGEAGLRVLENFCRSCAREGEEPC